MTHQFQEACQKQGADTNASNSKRAKTICKCMQFDSGNQVSGCLVKHAIVNM